MMNRIERKFSGHNEARLIYQDNDYQVKEPGDFVRCAATGEPIPLERLRYWNVEYQEAYVSAEASLKRLLQRRKKA